MKIKAIATTALLATVALTPASPLTGPVRADNGDVVAGMIIGGIIGSAITNENNKKKAARSTKSAPATPSVSSEQREANREVQTALNYFGYPVGTADGSLGRKSRAAISEYQAFLGYPATGELTERERTILVTSYHRAVAGGPVIASTVAGSAYGLKAVLVTQRDEMAGIATAAAAPVTGTVAAAPLVPQAPVVEEVAVAAPKVAEPEVAAAPVLPSFISPAGAKGSLAAACNSIGLETAANGGMTTAEAMEDASFALGEQFCLARTAAMVKGDALQANIAGFTPDQIAAQCAAFAPLLADHVAALSLRPAEEVLAGVTGFITGSGMAPAQLSGTAKVCLGVGYAQDDMGVAVGSALLLTAMGETGYAEYPGHHLSQGFGATERPDLAMGWYEMSLQAMGEGQMVVAPGQDGREALIRKAAYTINGRADELEPDATIKEAALPVFEVAPEPAPTVEILPEAVVAPVEEAAVVPPVPLTPAPRPAVESLVDAPDPAPVFVAPDLAKVVGGAPARVPGMEDASVAAASAQVAIMAARLPFMIFSSF